MLEAVLTVPKPDGSLEIPLAYVLAYHYGLGPQGVFWAITLAFSLLGVTAALLFRRGKWKLKAI